MTKNMGSIDRLLRTAIAIAVGGLYATGHLTGLAAAILGAFALIFLATSAAGSCPLYLPLGLSTRGKEKA